jgi:hypothetical protein
LILLHADVDQAGQERASREHDAARGKAHADLRNGAHDAIVFDNEVVDGLLENPQARLVFEARPDCRLVKNSAWARVARTAGPLRAFSIRNWIPASSAARAIAPPSASTSLTRCPLPMPPIDGLHDICPRVSTLCVNSNVEQPMRALASAASVPAWPPPTTIISKNSVG